MLDHSNDSARAYKRPVDDFNPHAARHFAKRLQADASVYQRFESHARTDWQAHNRDLTPSESDWLNWLRTFSGVLEIYSEQCLELAELIEAEHGLIANAQ